MFGNTTRALISAGVFILIVGGFLAFKFYYGKRNVNPQNSDSPEVQETEESSEDEDEDDSPVDFSKLEKY